MQINLPITVIFYYAHGYKIDLKLIIQLKREKINVRLINKSLQFEEKVKVTYSIGILIGKDIELGNYMYMRPTEGPVRFRE